jgi:hypothetical protein
MGLVIAQPFDFKSKCRLAISLFHVVQYYFYEGFQVVSPGNVHKIGACGIEDEGFELGDVVRFLFICC